MKIIKRNGSEVTFEVEKIVNAIAKANAEVPEDQRLTEREIQFASLNVTDECEKAGHTVTVEEVQDLVEDQLMALDRFEVARKYIIYRYIQNQKRHKNTTDDKILSLIECNNEEVKQENSNKNPTVVSVQRDYISAVSSQPSPIVLQSERICSAFSASSLMLGYGSKRSDFSSILLIGARKP